MVGIYFSGTGNTKFCVNKFLQYYNENNQISSYSIEDKESIKKIKDNENIILGYPIHYSDIPIIVREYIQNNSKIFKDKNIFVIATMGLFSGDGVGCSERLLKKSGANVIGGLHLKMPDCIGDVKALKKTLEENKEIVKNADIKIKRTVENIKKGNYCKEGLGIISHLAGLFGQRLYFYKKTYKLKDKLKINYEKCISCGKCETLCPMKNIKMIDNKLTTCNNCTSCYRCINNCPKQAITLIGNKVVEQCTIKKYIDEKNIKFI